MKNSNRGLQRFIFLIPAFIIMMLGLTCCERETPPPPVDPEPFVRLLKEQSFKSHILNRDISYAVLLPKDYDSLSESYPVVYLLHGYGDNEAAWYNYGLITYYVDANAAQTVPMIYVMPAGFNTYWVNKYNGNFPYMDMFVNELVPVIDSVFRTVRDPQHRAVLSSI